MLTINQIMALGKYKVISGSEYSTVKCFGSSAYQLAFNSTKNLEAIIDTERQIVYVVTIVDNKKQVCYRLINNEYATAFRDECDTSSLDKFHEDLNAIGIKLIDLDYKSDFIEKATAILNDEEYDSRVLVQFELDKNTMYNLMCTAHDRDITFNQLISEIVKKELDNFELHSE